MKKHPFIAASMTLLVGMALSAAEEGIPYDRHINIYWTDAAPELDGKMDEACWREAEVAGGFRRFSNKTEMAHPQTDVRVCYDADYLYFFYLCHDQNIDELRVGAPDDTRDVIDVQKDVVELFLDPGRTGVAYYQFCITPLGARFDMRVTPGKKRQVGLYTPEWNVAPHIGGKQWAVEFRIPFSELAFDGGFIGTPQAGDEWGINFCRDQGYRKEWSYWSPTRDHSFHRPGQIGVAVFKGRRKGEPLPGIKWAKDTTLDFGSNELTLQTDAKNLEADWRIRHDRQPAPVPDVKTAGGDDLTFTVRITDGGEWDVRVTVEQRRRRVFSGRVLATLPHVKKFLTTIHDRVQMGLKKIEDAAGTGSFTKLREKARELWVVVDPLVKQLKNPDRLTRAQWAALAEELPQIESRWKPLRYDLEMLRFYPVDATTVPRFAVGAVGPAERIFQDTTVTPVDGPIEIRGAGNERESFQLVLMPFWQDVDQVTVSFSPLTGEAGTIPGSSFELNVVGFVKLHKSWGGYWTPDVLYPDRTVSLRKNHTQPLWINVFIPPGTEAGNYRGQVLLTSGTQEVKVPIILRAYGFDIPEKRSISIDPWYWLDDGRAWRKYYDVDDVPFTPELYEKHLKTLSKYRYGCYPLATTTMWLKLKMYREDDGSLTFDFSGWDWIWKLGRKYGADNLGASFGCNFNALRPCFSGRLPIYDRNTGEEVATPGSYNRDIANWEYTYRVTGKTDFIANPLYRKYLAQLVEYLRENDLLDNAHYEIYDEPKTGNEWQDVLEMHGWLKQYVPDLKLKSYGVGPWRYEDRPEWSPVGFYDAWAPGLGSLTPERVAQLHERQAAGEDFWFYTCSARYRDVDRTSAPHICLYQNPLAPRMHGWAAWKLKADGFLIFALMCGHPENVQENPEKYYSEPVWESGRTAAQGYLVYPGDKQQLWPSIRLSSVRDGLEDYEYFAVLDECRKKLDPEKDAVLLREIKSELTVSEDILPWDWHEWTRDIGNLESKRQRLAALILRAEEAVSSQEPQ
ncbi:MAG: DUF6067 family protein [Candidatus Pacebacteria bacterium]|nr:DUF6067 family protein [Candidatus Paceibacterota bacterium]